MNDCRYMMQMERWPDNQPPMKPKEAAAAGIPNSGGGTEGRPRPITDGGGTLRIPRKGGGGGKLKGYRKEWMQTPGMVVSNGKRASGKSANADH